jgi:hypothetical protein
LDIVDHGCLTLMRVGWVTAVKMYMGLGAEEPALTNGIAALERMVNTECSVVEDENPAAKQPDSAESHQSCSSYSPQICG